ncbi:MAG: hypothetical protein IT479_11105 [Xanthomonadales bacterium]|nr:hypothetical protein [Xanthomonadales bacterium]MCE7930621.1 hypothetical protein [Xanthomonadales bacterium PRO6]
MPRILYLIVLNVLSSIVCAQPMPPPPPERLAPPVEHVLSRLELDNARREQVRQVLLRQRREHQQADTALRERHRSELAALLTPDQLVALEAARPSPDVRPPYASAQRAQ